MGPVYQIALFIYEKRTDSALGHAGKHPEELDVTVEKHCPVFLYE